MRKKKKARDWLYLKYKKEHQEAEERIEIAQNLGADPEKVIVKKVSFAGKLLDRLLDIGYWIIRITITLTILGLLSFALTILINDQLRTTVFDMIRMYF